VEISDQLQVPIALLPMKDPLVPIEQVVRWDPETTCLWKRRETFLPLPGIELRAFTYVDALSYLSTLYQL